MAIVLPPLKTFKRAALDLLFPRWCIGCGKEGKYICGGCRSSLNAIAPPVCPRCGRPLPGKAASSECLNCSGWQTVIEGIRAPFLFDGVIRHAIHKFKYRNLRALGDDLTGLLYDYLTANPVPGDVLVPVPLHPKRLRERGYNQSLLLAGGLSALTGLPVVVDSLIRPKYSPSQARSAGITARQANVVGAFACRDGRLSGKHVILIDDVSTSGATLNTCAGVLKSAGAAAVWGLVIALEHKIFI
jgi:competence protein ComFC